MVYYPASQNGRFLPSNAGIWNRCIGNLCEYAIFVFLQLWIYLELPVHFKNGIRILFFYFLYLVGICYLLEEATKKGERGGKEGEEPLLNMPMLRPYIREYNFQTG